jgi:uncharacterized membrane protein
VSGRISGLAVAMFMAYQSALAQPAHQDHLRGCDLPWGPTHCRLCASARVIDRHNTWRTFICPIQLQRVAVYNAAMSETCNKAELSRQPQFAHAAQTITCRLKEILRMKLKQDLHLGGHRVPARRRSTVRRASKKKATGRLLLLAYPHL